MPPTGSKTAMRVAVCTATGDGPLDARTVTRSPFLTFLPGAGTTAMTVPAFEDATAVTTFGFRPSLFKAAVYSLTGMPAIFGIVGPEAAFFAPPAAPPAAFFFFAAALAAAFFSFVVFAGLARNTRTAVPRATDSPASGIWLFTRKLSGASAGCVSPSSSPSSRRRASALTRVRPCRRGTSTLASPAATTMLTEAPLSTSVPADGDCSMTLPGSALGSARSWTGRLSTSSFSRSIFSATKESDTPRSGGTLVFWGSSRYSSSAAIASSRISPISHSGITGFWRKTTGRPVIGAPASAGPPRSRVSIAGSGLNFFSRL